MSVDDLIRHLPVLIAALFTAILFIQSGSDKVFDWDGNLGWLKGHFGNTPLAGMVPLMLGTITLMEIATGLLAAAGIAYFFAAGSTIVAYYAGALGAATITALFFGQRIAKDYPGAAVLVPYFLLMLALMWLSSPSARP